jgi:hypothetical protein
MHIYNEFSAKYDVTKLPVIGEVIDTVK